MARPAPLLALAALLGTLLCGESRAPPCFPYIHLRLPQAGAALGTSP